MLESHSVTILAGCYQEVHTHVLADGEGATCLEEKKPKSLHFCQVLLNYSCFTFVEHLFC